MKIFIFIFFMSIVNLYATPIFGGLSDIQGYKNISFGMNKEEVQNKITNSINTTEYEINAKFMETIKVREDTEYDKYYDEQSKLVYLFFFYKNSLYRIDVATHTGVRYDELLINNYVALSKIESMISVLKVKYGNFSKIDREFYSYKGDDFDIITYWWTSGFASVSLVVQPVIDTLKKEYKFYTYRLTYYDDISLNKMRDIILK